VVGKGGITGIGESIESTGTLGATVAVRHGGFSFSGTLAEVTISVSGIGIAVVSMVSISVSAISVVAGVAVVTTIVSSGGISLGFGISITFVELVDAISGSSSGDVLVAGSNSWAVAVVGTIRIAVSVGIAGIAVMASIQVCGIGLGISLGLSISGTLAVAVSISVSAISTVVSTIVSTAVTVSVSVAGVSVVSTIVGSGGIGISLGLGGHDGEESNGEKSLQINEKLPN
jgi:hypothetical protein